MQKTEKTILEMPLYDYDSLLLHLTPGSGALAIGRRRIREATQLTLPAAVDYTLSEPNVLLLDTAEVAVDGGAFEPEEEMLKAYKVCCEKLQMDWENAHLVQPWAYDKPKTEHTATLRFTVHSKINVTGARFALENADRSQIRVNGTPVSMTIEGYYTDHCLGTVPLPELKPGTTVIEVDTPIDETTGLEWCYLLGNFGVQLNGRAKTLVEMPEKLGFGPLTMQQLPFYGAAVTYQIPFSAKGGPLTVQIPHYRGAMVRISVDGHDCGPVIYPPYRLELGVLQPGEHQMNVTVYCSRENSFGPVHYADGKDNWIGPKVWRPEPEKWTYEYRLAEMGLLSSPVLSEGK